MNIGHELHVFDLEDGEQLLELESLAVLMVVKYVKKGSLVADQVIVDLLDFFYIDLVNGYPEVVDELLDFAEHAELGDLSVSLFCAVVLEHIEPDLVWLFLEPHVLAAVIFDEEGTFAFLIGELHVNRRNGLLLLQASIVDQHVLVLVEQALLVLVVAGV